MLPAYVAERIRRPAPPGCFVLRGSTPVVAFGDPRRSWAATLGLNPSRVEFEEGGVELDGARRRFETLRSLGVTSLEDAPDSVVRRVYERCNGYFHANPYRWFNDLERMLQAVGASYFGDTACHLDLSQWATDPTWNALPRPARDRLVEDDADFLRNQLRAEPIRLLLLNGRGVLRAFHSLLGGRLDEHPRTVVDRSVTARIYTGRYDEASVIGWSTNLQSSFGVSEKFRSALAARVGELSEQLREDLRDFCDEATRSTT